MSLISLFFTSFLTQNIFLTQFLGIYPLIGDASKEKHALHMGLWVTIVTIVSTMITYLFVHLILIPMHLTHFRTISFVFIIMFILGIFLFINKKKTPFFNTYLWLVTVNSVSLGILLLGDQPNFSLLETMINCLGSGLGFTFVLYLFSTICTYLERKNIPKSFQGYPIILITAGIMTILLTRYIGG